MTSTYVPDGMSLITVYAPIWQWAHDDLCLFFICQQMSCSKPSVFKALVNAVY
jgi:hypothetical protein